MELFGIKLGTAAIVALGTGALLLGAATIGLKAVSTFQETLSSIAQQVRQERDAFWQLEIQKANSAAAAAKAEQAKAVIEIQADATDRVNAATQELEEVRKRNAALSNGGDRGLAADRVGLLPK
ncbi:hypothetical protein [Rhizobium metallidurans]|uniref:DsDNA-specific endonuclease/ATPase MutS2 n=1 Tax=Rhizobium metallidurans TaxID=1265931 RepID=A0A7W6GA82_9HYPH|nr:hypothetical protein [Rhizobium metallidurans]MBB3963504.1 dsDNA-specific endonuclease/ATPase MutS2 [Rhizobium metallidurans]